MLENSPENAGKLKGKKRWKTYRKKMLENLKEKTVGKLTGKKCWKTSRKKRWKT